LQAQTGDAVRRVDVAEVVTGVVGRFPAQRVEVATIEAGLELEAPPEALGQALSSLVKNALDASPSEALVRMEIRSAGERVEFWVEDRGAGLDPAARSHAGEPFFTTKPTAQGMGLGLFLVRLLAQRLDGEFRLESLERGGTRAVLSLPGGRVRSGGL
jgi:two-component system sensor histidine kinase RegB